MLNALAMNTELLGREVDLGTIGKELRKLWDEDEARTNASLINLAVYSENPASLETNSKLVSKLTKEHACRALLIGMDRNAPEASIRSWITAHCHLSHGQKSVCCEQIAFLLTGKAQGRLRNTIFAHLDSDLPLVFWWQGAISDLFDDRLYRIIDRFVYDSTEWESLKDGYDKIGEAMEKAGRSLVVQDLAWTRSYHIRLSIAALFNDPRANESLSTLSQVKITANEEQCSTAMLLLAWVATQLGFGFEQGATSEEGFVYQFTHQDGRRFEGLLSWKEGAPVSAVSLLSDQGEVRITRETGSPHLALSLNYGDHLVKHSAPASSIDASELVDDQLSRGGKNSLMRKTLPLFREMLG